MARPVQSQATTDLIAQQAVSLVREVVLNQLHWLFREQDVSDYGVDAHVEVLEAGSATGNLLALQIKGGSSAFDKPTDDGWFFPVKSRHASYWLGHSLPVVLVLVDLDARKCYWQSISSVTLISTGKNFKILVPRANELALAAGDWKSLTAKYLEDARLRYESHKAVLPPSAVRSLEHLWESFPTMAGTLAADLAAGRGDPAAAIRELTRSRAEWLDEQGPAAWLCLVNFAVEHGLHDQASEIYRRLSGLRPERRATDLANAAIQLFGTNAAEGQRLALAARELEPDDSTVLVASAVLGLDEDESLRALAGRTDRIVVSYFADRAVRRGDDTEAIRLYRDVLAEDPDSSGVRFELARLFLRRSISPEADVDDLRVAEEYARAVLEQRRHWRDDTADVLAVYLRCLALQSRFRDMLQAAAVPPIGSASAIEAGATEVALLALDAARRLGRSELLPELAAAIADGQDRMLALEGVEISQTDHDAQVGYARRLLVRALERNDGQAVLGNAMRLAELGVDESASLGGKAPALGIPLSTFPLIAAIAASRTDPRGSLTTLRALARTEIAAAEIVVDILSDDPSPQQAIEACDLYYELYKSPSFMMSRAHLHIRHGQRNEAVDLMEEALLHERLEGESLRHAHALLGEHNGEAQNWSAAAHHFRAALKDSEPADPAAFWNLLRCLIALGDFATARRLWDEHEIEPTNEDQIKVWAEVISETGWTETTASFAVTLALQDDRTPQLASALLGRVVLQTQGAPPELDEESDEETPTADSRPIVPGSIHARAFAALDVLIDRHGDQIGFRKFTFDETTFLEDLRALFANRDARPLKALARQVKRGLVPIGMLCEVRSDPYGLILANRTEVVRVASYQDGDSHEAETNAAAAAQGGRIVVDLSAIDLALELEIWDRVAAEFNVVLVATQQKADAASSVVAARSATASRGTLGVDAEGNLRMVELDPKDQLAVLQRCEAIERTTRRLSAIAVTGELTATAELKELGEPAWLASVELASREGVALWSDDLGQRRVAMTLGIPTFGTVNLVERSILAGLEPPATPEAINAAIEDQHAFVLQLLEHRVVDQPVTEADLLANIEAHPGELAPGAEVLARAPWWAEPDAPQTWLRLIAAVRQHAPETVRAWQSRGMTGLVEATSPQVAPRLLALIAALGCMDAPGVDEAVEGFLLADAICREFELSIASAHLAWAAASVADRLPDQGAADFTSEVTAKLAERFASVAQI